ncbi:RidA family protein [Xanthomonas euvesicatoria]|uniref:RidA family protein n=1 Tax=Xanthomonas euvesicatoria TaxID=456327 RepID=UPI002404D95F|nr:RidA family protein [Xanthomonas euvesicatoria]MCP3042451.1 RidA family protein [Xanthomonas euvesicatoria pv. allii]
MPDNTVARLRELGIALPVPPRPLGAYRAVQRSGLLLHVSMQMPLADGKPAFVGLVGGKVSIEEALQASRLCVLNALAQIHEHLGRPEAIRQVVRLDAYVACVDGFARHPEVVDGASQLLAQVFGERAGHVRSVCGVRNLPSNVPVALNLQVEISV